MRFFDIGANRGDATYVAVKQGYEQIIAIEPAPRVYAQLVQNFFWTPIVTPLRFAVSDVDYERITFYEAEEDGLSTLNREWLTGENMPYLGKPFREIHANTITIDTLADIYGEPTLIKIDVEGAEWNVLRGMSRAYGTLALEWTFATLDEHEAQMDYLYKIGYREVAAQYIVGHLDEPKVWGELQPNNKRQLLAWHQTTSDEWIDGGWEVAGLRPTADVGMLWVR